ALSLPARIYGGVEGANSDIRIGVIGFNGRGKDHIGGLLGCKGVRITALCDVDSRVLERGKGELEKKGQQVQTYTDIRKLLESKEVDAISTATPNHWHALASIWAIQAGKDVYVEKPVSHNVWEGRKIVEAAQKHGRICQTGTQSRSSVGLHEALAWVNAGNLGKVLWARGTCYKRRASIGKVSGEQPWPEKIDKDLWFGPAPIKPLMREKLHYDWHWVWDTGNGDLGNQGIHQMDIARWFLGEGALSPSILSVGGRVGYVDDGETPNTMFVMHNYQKAPLIFEVRGLPSEPAKMTVAADGSEKKGAEKMDLYRDTSVGVVIQYEGGHIVIPSYTNVEAFDKEGKSIKKWESKGGESHYANFIKAVRSRKSSDLNADIIEGHLSSALCHTGNISYVLGKKSEPDSIREKIKADKEATDSFDRMIEHLGRNGVDPKKEQLAIGEHLKMDPKTEKFLGNAAADKLLTREYRKPFEIV
ncbi:MAG TPA: Gfo/Idh/MocA family oxidoreductase, partial [Chthoniobacteraceae bacterium]|nr:Gfo/Idh/MocA family oxidoreductase [Chthoniobacteraceae bacterium]